VKASVVALVALVGCGGIIDRQAASSTLKILEASQLAARQLVDVELAREALAGGIVQLQAFAIAYPDERRFADLHADAVCDYATAFVFDDWEDASLGGRLDEARHAADRLNLLLGDCISLEQARLPRGWTPTSLGIADVPAALAIARARAASLALAPMTALAELPGLRRLLERCAMLRPGYHDADAELLLGTLDAGVSAFTHGPDGSEWFAKATKLAGDGVLVIAVLHARAVTVARHDRAAFATELDRIANADLSKWPEHRLANALAVRKARRYLANQAALFE
jgi:TRAP transporter T-component